MSDTPTTREYRVLVFDYRGDGGKILFRDLGFGNAHSADRAIEAAAEADPENCRDRTMIAVPRSNWTERRPAIDLVPKVTLLQPDGQATIGTVEESNEADGLAEAAR